MKRFCDPVHLALAMTGMVLPFILSVGKDGTILIPLVGLLFLAGTQYIYNLRPRQEDEVPFEDRSRRMAELSLRTTVHSFHSGFVLPTKDSAPTGTFRLWFWSWLFVLLFTLFTTVLLVNRISPYKMWTMDELARYLPLYAVILTLAIMDLIRMLLRRRSPHEDLQ